MFQIVVAAGQVRDIIAVKEPRPVATGDFEEMDDGWLQITGFGPPTVHGAEQALEVPAHMSPIKLSRVAQDVGRCVYPSIGTLNRIPKRGRFPQAPL